MKLDDYQFFLQENIFDLRNMGAHYFSNYHTSPAGGVALSCVHRGFEACSGKGENPSSDYVHVGGDQLLKADASECLRDGEDGHLLQKRRHDGCFIALLEDKGYMFSGTEMDLHCTCRLRAPILGQQRVHAEASGILFSYHRGRASPLAGPLRILSLHPSFRCGNATYSSSTVWRPPRP